jgi:hypothetical protein
MEIEHTKQEHKNQPPKHAERGPGLRLLRTQRGDSRNVARGRAGIRAKGRRASHAGAGTVNLANGKPGEKAIATEKAPGANIGKCWGRGRDGCNDRCITFGLKNDGEGGGAWCEIAARVRCEISADQTERKGKRGPGLIRGLHLLQGLTGKGARPAVRLAPDGHFPREQGLVVTGVYTDRDHLGTGGLGSVLRAARLRAVGDGGILGRFRRWRRLPEVSRLLAEVSSRRATGRMSGVGPLAGSRLARGHSLPGPLGPARTGCQLGRESIHSGAVLRDLGGSAQPRVPETGAAARRWRSATV